MRFVVHCLDKPGASPLRLQHYEDHKAHLATETSRPSSPARCLLTMARR